MISKIKKLYDVIEKATQEILILQENCLHLNTRMGICKVGMGETYDIKICYDCDKILESMSNSIPNDTITYPVTFEVIN